MKFILVVVALIGTVNAMEIEETLTPPPAIIAPQASLDQQVFEELLAVMEGRCAFNQKLYDWINDTGIPVKERIAEFERQSGRRISDNEVLGRFRDYKNKIAIDLLHYKNLISEFKKVITSTNSQERERFANCLYAYLQWTRKAEDSEIVENAEEGFHEIEFYEEMIGFLERLPITDAYKNFHHYIVIKVNGTQQDGFDCLELKKSINTLIKKISELHNGDFLKVLKKLAEEQTEQQLDSEKLIYSSSVSTAEKIYGRLQSRYFQILDDLKSYTAPYSSSLYSSKKELLEKVPLIVERIQELEHMKEQFKKVEKSIRYLAEEDPVAKDILKCIQEEEEQEKARFAQEKNDRKERRKERKHEEKRKAQQEQSLTKEPVMLKPAATDESSQGAEAAAPKKTKEKTRSKTDKSGEQTESSEKAETHKASAAPEETTTLKAPVWIIPEWVTKLVNDIKDSDFDVASTLLTGELKAERKPTSKGFVFKFRSPVDNGLYAFYAHNPHALQSEKRFPGWKENALDAFGRAHMK